MASAMESALEWSDSPKTADWVLGWKRVEAGADERRVVGEEELERLRGVDVLGSGDERLEAETVYMDGKVLCEVTAACDLGSDEADGGEEQRGGERLVGFAVGGGAKLV